MGKLRSLLIGTLIGAGGMYVGLEYHLLQAEEGFLIVPRMPQQRLQDTYADVRDWDAATWTARPQIALAVTQHGRSDLISEGVGTGLLDSLRDSIAPVQQRLNKTSSGWEPTTTSRIPSGGEGREAQRSAPSAPAPPKRGFLPLAELFGIKEQTQSSTGDAPMLKADDPSITPILPAGVSVPKEVEILPSPYEFEILPGPEDVEFGPSGPIPGTKHNMDRRRSDAIGGWEPITLLPF